MTARETPSTDDEPGQAVGPDTVEAVVAWPYWNIDSIAKPVLSSGSNSARITALEDALKDLGLAT